jgi:hypothetical protein
VGRAANSVYRNSHSGRSQVSRPTAWAWAISGGAGAKADERGLSSKSLSHGTWTDC